MTRDDIKRIMDEVPNLNDFGIGMHHPRHAKPEARERELAENKAKLLDSVEACTRVCDWLSQVDKIKTIRTGQTSYGLKHIAENDVGYITNGVFITAAIHCGFPYRITPGSPNVAFGMSRKSLNAIQKRQSEQKRANAVG